MKNKNLKNKNDFVLKEKDSLQNKLENISKKNKDFVFHVSSSKIDNDICIMKKNNDCLGSTLSQCAFNIIDWNSYFARNKFHMFMHIPHGIHMHTMLTPLIHHSYVC